jgi:hypothetical protein
VVCDIGNKLTFAEGGEPAAFTEATGKFIRETAARLVEEGAYLQAADGEGVVGVFGFPAPDPEHTQKAARVVLDMIKNSRERGEDKEKVAPAGTSGPESAPARSLPVHYKRAAAAAPGERRAHRPGAQILRPESFLRIQGLDGHGDF